MSDVGVLVTLDDESSRTGRSSTTPVVTSRRSVHS